MIKGLNPKARMKSSGVEWLGEVPENWQLEPLFLLANECNNSNKGMIEDNLLSLSYGKVIKKILIRMMGYCLSHLKLIK